MDSFPEVFAGLAAIVTGIVAIVNHFKPEKSRKECEANNEQKGEVIKPEGEPVAKEAVEPEQKVHVFKYKFLCPENVSVLTYHETIYKESEVICSSINESSSFYFVNAESPSVDYGYFNQNVCLNIIFNLSFASDPLKKLFELTQSIDSKYLVLPFDQEMELDICEMKNDDCSSDSSMEKDNELENQIIQDGLLWESNETNYVIRSVNGAYRLIIEWAKNNYSKDERADAIRGFVTKYKIRDEAGRVMLVLNEKEEFLFAKKALDVYLKKHASQDLHDLLAHFNKSKVIRFQSWGDFCPDQDTFLKYAKGLQNIGFVFPVKCGESEMFYIMPEAIRRLFCSLLSNSEETPIKDVDGFGRILNFERLDNKDTRYVRQI